MLGFSTGRYCTFVVVLGVGLSVAKGTSAQTTDAATAAAAEHFFVEGRALMQEQRYEEACPRFAESLRLDPATGTMINLAECYEQIGRMASAWATYRSAETAAARQGHAPRRAYAAAAIERTSKLLAYLTVDVESPPPAASRGRRRPTSSTRAARSSVSAIPSTSRSRR